MMSLLDCQVVIIDDANINDRLGTLAKRLRVVLADGDVSDVDGPRWPAFERSRQTVPVVAFVHWREGAARYLVRDLKGIRPECPEYSERIAAIVAYRGERALIAPTMENLGLAPRSGSGLYPVVTATGREIPVLALDRPVVSGAEMDQELIEELLTWACATDGAASWTLPASLRPRTAWLSVAMVLLKIYIAARMPDRLSISPELAGASAGYREKVLQPEFWCPLGQSLAMIPGAPTANGLPTVAAVLGRLRRELRLPSRRASEQMSPEGWDEEVWQLWSECQSLRIARRAE